MHHYQNRKQNNKTRYKIDGEVMNDVGYHTFLDEVTPDLVIVNNILGQFTIENNNTY
jgi:hypothetical protein